MIAYVVVMYLSIINADTGNTLYQYREPLNAIAGADPISRFKDCLEHGTSQASTIAEIWRRTYPNAFAHVNCKWESTNG